MAKSFELQIKEFENMTAEKSEKLLGKYALIYQVV